MSLAQLATTYHDVALDPLSAIRAAKKIRGITYTDEHSSENCSLNDLKIGHENCVVGCNSKVFGSSSTKSGDLVVIKANDGKRHFMTMGILNTFLSSCDAWKDKGGNVWLYNYSYIPITDIFEITPSFREEVLRLGKEHSCNGLNFFNSRFTSEKLRPIFLSLFERNLIPAATI